MTKPTTPTHALSSDCLQTLQNYTTILHLLHHRNHNQHRRSPWYRHFSTFRRHLSRLLPTLTVLSTPPGPDSKHVERTRWKAELPALSDWVDRELALWAEVLVPKWQRAFSQVVADGRFGVVGVVLVGVLAGVCGVVGVTGVLEEVAQREVESVLEEFGREAGGLGMEEWRTGERGVGNGGVEEGEVGNGEFGEKVARTALDQGEVVAREGLDEGEMVTREPADDSEPMPRETGAQGNGNTQAAGEASGSTTPAVRVRTRVAPKQISSDEEQPEKKNATGTKRRTDPRTKPSSKKKRKKGDAIDQLFSGL